MRPSATASGVGAPLTVTFPRRALRPVGPSTLSACAIYEQAAVKRESSRVFQPRRVSVGAPAAAPRSPLSAAGKAGQFEGNPWALMGSLQNTPVAQRLLIPTRPPEPAGRLDPPTTFSRPRDAHAIPAGPARDHSTIYPASPFDGSVPLHPIRGRPHSCFRDRAPRTSHGTTARSGPFIPSVLSHACGQPPYGQPEQQVQQNMILRIHDSIIQ